MSKILIYTDGASRGNPGHSAIAYLIMNEKGEILKEYSEYIGITTNNVAEYKALIKALTSSIEFGKELRCFE